MIIQDLIAHFGNKSRLADALNVSRSAVTQWGINGIPPMRAIAIESITEGKFKAADMVRGGDDENL